MPDSNKLNKSSSETAKTIFDELSEHRVATLGSVGRGNLPHLTAVYYTINEDFVMYFVTKHKTLKQENMQRNKNVMLLVFDEKKQLTIQIKGVAEEVKDEEHRVNIIDNAYWIAAESDYESPPISKIDAGDYVAYQVIPKNISMALFLKPHSGGYVMFEELDFEDEQSDAVD